MRLPWRTPLERWHEKKITIIPVKSGLSRHVVRFVKFDGRSIAVKETTLTGAEAELRNYRNSCAAESRPSCRSELSSGKTGQMPL